MEKQLYLNENEGIKYIPNALSSEIYIAEAFTTSLLHHNKTLQKPSTHKTCAPRYKKAPTT